MSQRSGSSGLQPFSLVWPNNRHASSGGGSNSSSNKSDNLASATLDMVLKILSTGVSIYVAYRVLGMLSEVLDLNQNNKAATVSTAKRLAKRLNRPEIELMEFDSYEQRLLNDIIGPNELEVSFSDIGGMKNELEEVLDNIIMPLRYWNIQQEKRKRIAAGATGTAGQQKQYSSSGDDDDDGCRCPSGVLLYGAPGTGKSLTAKAIAKEAGATFLNIKASNIMDKYLGESDKIVSAIFRLGRKLGPTIIFIDEIETILRKRDSANPFGSTGVSSMQGVFLSEWDGLNVQRNNNSAVQQQLVKSNSSTAAALYDAPVVILGATNRPMDLDSAFLRRMPVKILTRVPDLAGRVAIFRAKLLRELLAADVNLEALAQQTEQMTGSDIAEIIRLAKQQRLKARIKLSQQQSQEMVADVADSSRSGSSSDDATIAGGKWPLTSEHFAFALHKVQHSGAQTKKFSAELTMKELVDRGYIVDHCTA